MFIFCFYHNLRVYHLPSAQNYFWEKPPSNWANWENFCKWAVAHRKHIVFWYTLMLLINIFWPTRIQNLAFNTNLVFGDRLFPHRYYLSTVYIEVYILYITDVYNVHINLNNYISKEVCIESSVFIYCALVYLTEMDINYVSALRDLDTFKSRLLGHFTHST